MPVFLLPDYTRRLLSAALPFASGIGVNCIGSSVLAGAAAGVNCVIPRFGFAPEAAVGRPTGTIIVLSTPLTVMIKEVFDLAGLEQYPISTQLRPLSPWKGGV